MKKLSILSVLFFLTCTTTFAQENKPASSDKSQNLKRHINELAYQFPFMIEYGYFHNFNDIIMPGFSIKLGLGASVNGYYGTPETELIAGEINFRNAFSRIKNSHFLDYDFGFVFSWTPLNEGLYFYGLNLQNNFRVYKFLKLGLDIKLGNDHRSNGRDYLWMFWYPYLLFSF
jgi:hypothetical protein